jgi:hypothetical protein
MPFNAQVLEVMIASPGDVPQERQTVREVVNEWNDVHARDRGQVLLPVSWENRASPLMGAHPQKIINEQVLEDADLLVAVFWTRIGSRTDESVSGTVEELQSHIKAGKPAMLYFSAAPVAPDSIDPKQYAALKAFKKECQAKGLYESYESITEFREKLTRQLALTINRQFSAAAVTTDDAPVDAAPLGDAARTLLLTATAEGLSKGTIMYIRSFEGASVQAGGQQLASDQKDAREEARWRAGIRELTDRQFIEDRGGRGQVYQVILHAAQHDTCSKV